MGGGGMRGEGQGEGARRKGAGRKGAGNKLGEQVTGRRQLPAMAAAADICRRLPLGSALVPQSRRPDPGWRQYRLPSLA